MGPWKRFGDPQGLADHILRSIGLKMLPFYYSETDSVSTYYYQAPDSVSTYYYPVVAEQVSYEARVGGNGQGGAAKMGCSFSFLLSQSAWAVSVDNTRSLPSWRLFSASGGGRNKK